MKHKLNGSLASRTIDIPEGFQILETGTIVQAGDMFLLGGENNVANGILAPQFKCFDSHHIENKMQINEFMFAIGPVN